MRLELKHQKEYFSASQLKKLFISLGQFQAYLRRDFVPNAGMELGTIIHERILEPEKYQEKYISIDDTAIKAEIGGARPTSTKKYKEWLQSAEAEAEAKGKVIISSATEFIVNKIYRDMLMSGVLETYFEGGEAEKTVKGIVDIDGVEIPSLAIIDYDKPDFSVDLKTTGKDISKFRFDANSLGYDIQARLTHGINGKPFYFVVVQTVAPYDIAVFTTSEFFMNRGEDKIKVALQNYEHYDNEHSKQILYGEL